MLISKIGTNVLKLIPLNFIKFLRFLFLFVIGGIQGILRFTEKNLEYICKDNGWNSLISLRKLH